MNFVPPQNSTCREISPEETLRLFAKANPPAGLKERIEIRLSQEQTLQRTAKASRWSQQIFFFSAHPRLATASLLGAVCLMAGFGLHHLHSSAPLPPPIRMNPGSMGAAGAIRVAPAGVRAPEAIAPTSSLAGRENHGRGVVISGKKPLPKSAVVPKNLPQAEESADQGKK